MSTSDWPNCPNCGTPLEFEYGEGFLYCERCGFEHHEGDL